MNNKELSQSFQQQAMCINTDIVNGDLDSAMERINLLHTWFICKRYDMTNSKYKKSKGESDTTNGTNDNERSNGVSEDKKD